MPGVTDVATVPTGVAVRAATFGQCIDAVRALDVQWAPGTAEGKSDDDVLAELIAAELPMTPPVPLLAKTIDRRFSFAFASNSPLETNCAVAHRRSASPRIRSRATSCTVAVRSVATSSSTPRWKRR
jgi:isoquinoline 1-oxidoreductase beta subunit